MTLEINSLTSGESGLRSLNDEVLLRAEGISKVFESGTFRKHYTRALDTVTLSILSKPPTITAVAGESGSGKTTLARVILGLVTPTTGRVEYRGQDIATMNRRERAEFRREVQVIFQDPFESYNPFYKVDHVLRVPLKRYGLASSGSEVDGLVENALRTVGLRPEETLGRHPHQLSGGQRQRVMVARAVMLNPKIIVADEPVSMVDASLRATILETLRAMNEELGISILYITHDLTTAYQLAENIVILYRGRVAEAGAVDDVINNPSHPYTQMLVDSIPRPDPDLQWGMFQNDGAMDDSADEGCNFYDRCPMRMDRCTERDPWLYQTESHRVTRCYLHDESPVYELDDLRGIFDAPKDSMRLNDV